MRNIDNNQDKHLSKVPTVPFPLKPTSEPRGVGGSRSWYQGGGTSENTHDDLRGRQGAPGCAQVEVTAEENFPRLDDKLGRTIKGQILSFSVANDHFPGRGKSSNSTGHVPWLC